MLTVNNKGIKDTHKEKDHQIKLQRLQKIGKLAFGSLVQQINFLKEVLKLTQNLQKKEKKVVTGKTPFYVIGPFCIHHSICLNIGFRYSSFVWKSYPFNLTAFN